MDIETSGFGLSVGTGIALEALFIPTHPRIDEDLEIDKIDLKPDTKIYISLHTLIRNIVGSITNVEDRNMITKTTNLKGLKEHLINELEILSSISDNEVIVYNTIYKKGDKLKPQQSDKNTTKDIILSITDKLSSTIPNIYNKRLDEKFGNAVIITHVSMDLVNNESDRKTILLESHTGRTLTPKEYGKKLRKSTLDTSKLPLNRTTLLLFGDSSGMLKIPSPKYKKIAYDALVSAGVTALTRNKKCEIIIKKTECAQFI